VAADPRRPYGLLAVYGLAHAAVDAVCMVLLFSGVAAGRLPLAHGLTAAVAYNLLAFAAQPVLGWLVNDAATARRWAFVGAVTTALAVLVSVLPGAFWPALVVAGIGNSVFHIGGGVVALLLDPGKATAPALFVAPGAAGLAAGIALGSTPAGLWVAPLLLLALAALVAVVPVRVAAPEGGPGVRRSPLGSLAIALPLLLVVVGMRSFVGAALALPWKADPLLLVLLTAGVVGGKALGGVLADRFGMGRIGVGALLASLPLLLVAQSVPAMGIVGMLLFNMTMPITLVAVADTVPERPGFAFGLTCLALVTGALPPLLRLAPTMSAGLLTACVLVSAALLAPALRRGPVTAPRSLPALSEQEA